MVVLPQTHTWALLVAVIAFLGEFLDASLFVGGFSSHQVPRVRKSNRT